LLVCLCGGEWRVVSGEHFEYHSPLTSFGF